MLMIWISLKQLECDHITIWIISSHGTLFLSAGFEWKKKITSKISQYLQQVLWVHPSPIFQPPHSTPFDCIENKKKKSKTNKNLSCDSAHLLSPWRRRKNHFPFQVFLRWFTKKKKRKKKKQSNKNIRVKRRHFLFESLAKCFCFVFCFLHFFTKCIRHRDRISTEIFLINRISWINQTIHFIILANEKSISGSILHCTHIGVK